MSSLGIKPTDIEMLIAENGPILVHADPIIRRSLNSYFREHNQSDGGKWHFLKTKSRVQENTDKSIVIEKLKAERSKLSFMDEGDKKTMSDEKQL